MNYAARVYANLAAALLATLLAIGTVWISLESPPQDILRGAYLIAMAIFFYLVSWLHLDAARRLIWPEAE
jgi:FtsH-binding integral membrane protein